MSALHKQESQQRRTLLIVLILNLLLAIALGVGGLLADSSALLANAADNASDAAVYLLSLLAIGRAAHWKRGAATASGILLLLFAVGVLFDVTRRWLFGAEPYGTTMMALALVAAVTNLVCLALLRKDRSKDVNMQAAETFSFNDFASNGGILIAGGLVLWLRQPWPDLVVGIVVAGVAIKGAIEILQSVKADKEESAS